MLHGDIVQIRFMFRRSTWILQVRCRCFHVVDVSTWFSRHDGPFMPEDSIHRFRPQHTCDSGPRSKRSYPTMETSCRWSCSVPSHADNFHLFSPSPVFKHNIGTSLQLNLYDTCITYKRHLQCSVTPSPKSSPLSPSPSPTTPPTLETPCSPLCSPTDLKYAISIQLYSLPQSQLTTPSFQDRCRKPH
jgi:hypothetical protein